MKHYAASFTRRNVRAYLAGLLSYVLIMGQMAPLALAASPSAPRVSPPSDVARASADKAPTLKAAPAPLAAPAFAPIITATKTDAYAGAPAPALPGATITYTITINNTGPDPATNLTLTDTVDPNTTIVPGSAVATPIAVDETYNVIGNVRIQPNVAQGLLANDNNPNTGNTTGLTVTGPNAGPTNGQATVNADGSFTYNPNPGFTGTDSFTYTVTSANGSDTATATFNVGNGSATLAGANDPVIWFIDDSAAAGGDGRLTTPFNCIVGPGCFDAVAADQAGDNIFVHAGTYTDTAALTLLNNQRVIGQGASTTLAAIAVVTVQPYSDALPTLSNDPSVVTINSAASGIVVTTGNTNTLRGFTLNNNGSGAKIFSTAFTTLNVSEVALSGTGQALNLDSGALAATFTSISSTTSAGQGINLDQITGSLTATGGTSITDPTTQCILVTASTANMSFGNTTCTDATDGISLGNNSAGTRSFGTLSVTNGTGVAFFHNNGGGITNITGATTITNPGGKGIDIQDSTTAVTFANTTVNGSAGTGVELGGTGDGNSGAVTFADLDIAPDPSVRAFHAVDNTGTITTTSGTISNTSTATTFEIDGPAGRTPLAMVLNSISSDGGANGAIIMDASGTFTNGTTSLLNNAGIGLLVSNSTATFGFGNTTVTSSAGDGVDLSSNTGAITFADLDITPDAGLRGLDAVNNTGTITTTSGDISTNNAPALNIAGASAAARTPLALTLNNVDATAVGSGLGVDLNFVSGNLTVNDGTLATSIATTGTGGGIQVRNTAAGGTMNFGVTNVTGAGTGTAVVLGTGGNGNAGNVTFGNLTVGVSTATRYGGPGVSITDGTGTDSFGVLNIFTTNQTGLAATNFDGTLNATSGTVDTGTGASVNIDGPAGLTTLGVSLTRVVSAGGTTPGITVRDTDGSFAVVGTGGACTGAGDCTGGSISGKTGTSETSGTPGVRVFNATNFRLTRVNISGNNHSGIYGGSVNAVGTIDASIINGFQLTSCNIVNNGNDTVSNPDEGGVVLYNVVGTNSAGANPTSITNSTITNNRETQAQVNNSSATVLTSFDMSGNTLSSNGAGTNSNIFSFLVPVGGSATMTLNITSGTFTGAAPNTASGIQCDHSGTGGTMTCNVSGGTFNTNNVGIEGTAANAGNLNFIFQNNNLPSNRSHGLNSFINASSTGTINGKFLNNIIGASGVTDSGSAIGNGIRVQNESQVNAGVANFLISGNTVQEVGTQTGVAVNQGITGSGDIDSKPTNVTITNNIVRDMDDGRAIIVSYNDNDAGAVGQTCADISGNEMNNIAGQVGDGTKIRVAGLGTATFRVRQTSAADLAAQNSPPVGVAVTTTTAAQISVRNPVTFNGGVCTQPTNAPLEFTSSIGGDEITPGGVPTLGAPTSEGTGLTVAPPRTAKPQAARPTAQPQRPVTIAKTSLVQAQADPTAQKAAPGKRIGKPDAPTSTGGDTPTLNPPVINGDQLTWNIGTLPAGASVTITFQVTIDNPFTGGLPQVSNQGTVTADGGISVLTDDPSVGGANDPTVTPVAATNVRINDATVAEPSSGTAEMLFTLTLTQPAPGGGLSVTYNTANGTATGGAACGSTVDYVSVTNGTATVPAGSMTTTIPITVCADTDSPESSETLTVTISAPTSGSIVDPTATGTITQGTTAGTFIISELRTSGPGGPDDDYVELYNNTDSPLTVAASDATAGYGVFKMGATCADTPVLLTTIPNGTIIPARGHYLTTGSAYSLSNYGGTGAAATNATFANPLGNDQNVAVFSTSDAAFISTANRLDAVGFGTNTGGVCNVMREANNLAPTSGSALEYAYFRNLCDFVSGTGCAVPGNPKDTNDNLADFMFADTEGTPISGIPQKLGAPGPENLASPIRRDRTGVNLPLLDGTKISAAPPNRMRDFTSDPANNSTFGTLSVRRRVTNNSGGNVTRLRFRIIEMTTFPAAPGRADMRARPSADLTVSGITDPGTCAAESGSPAPPCTVNVRGLTLETPPSQPNGGGINSTFAVTLGTPLANGASINVDFRLGLQMTGTFRFLLIVEALP